MATWEIRDRVIRRETPVDNGSEVLMALILTQIRVRPVTRRRIVVKRVLSFVDDVSGIDGYRCRIECSYSEAKVEMGGIYRKNE